MRKWKIALALLPGMLSPSLSADLVGHGGPVRGMALTQDGTGLITGSFDSTVIRWSLRRSVALEVKRFHEGPVNAVVALPGDRFASAGADGRIAIWLAGKTSPDQILDGHTGPVVALGVSPDVLSIASASWDGTARLWSLADGAGKILADHGGNLNGIGFTSEGIVSAGYDGKLRFFKGDALVRTLDVGVPITTLATAQGTIIVGCADGTVRVFSGGEPVATVAVSQTPISSFALSNELLAAAGFRGTLALLSLKTWQILRVLDGPAFPVWSIGFSADGRELMTGGANRIVRRWSVDTGEPISPVDAGMDEDIPAALRTLPGADVFKACAACHTLKPGDGNRAGPSLAGLFGRRIGTLPGYDFSPALRQLNIVWTEDTVQRLFELGPAAYTPGTKMPEQKILSPEDRRALTDFLRAAQ